jgi:hypothetical protein
VKWEWSPGEIVLRLSKKEARAVRFSKVIWIALVKNLACHNVTRVSVVNTVVGVVTMKTSTFLAKRHKAKVYILQIYV